MSEPAPESRMWAYAPLPAPEPQLDPRWEWCEVTALSDPAPVYVKTRCNHLETVPVTSRDVLERGLGEPGQVVGHLCLTCDGQLSAEWRPAD